MLKELLNFKTILKEHAAMKGAIGDQNINEYIDISKQYDKKLIELEKIDHNIIKASNQLKSMDQDISEKKDQLLVVDEAILMESFSLYRPKYDFANSDLYMERLNEIRRKQKDMIKSKTACTGNQNWTVNGKKSEGKKMVNDMIKLLLRSFNNECEDSINKVKFNNIELGEKRIDKSFETINKLGRVMNIKIADKYRRLKHEELHLAHEYQFKKHEEKEEQKRLREELREEKKLEREIEEARKAIQKEQKHYLKAKKELEKQLESASEDEKSKIQEKLNEVNNNLGEIDKNLKDVDYREANKRAGYVYVISNIGSFGEGVYKIGMTRRLEPMDRVNELGDASVPFNFDVHAMIFSDDAPTLENNLHKAFDKHKVNMINTRREFFKVALDDIERVVKENHDKTVEFYKVPDAEQFRESKKIKELSS